MTPSEAYQEVISYVNTCNSDDCYNSPSDAALREISQLVDGSAKRAFAAAQTQLTSSTPVKRGVKALKDGPRLCGRFSPSKATLNGITSYEQMAIVSEWVDSTKPTEVHTFAFDAPDDRVIPIYVRPPKKSPVTTMHVMIGAGKDIPKYTQWAKADPRNTPQELYIAPLLSLEEQRQPSCLASQMIRHAAYENDDISSDWRYGDAHASVELRRQRSTQACRVKEKSAGGNLAKMMQDPHLRDTNLMPNEPLFEGHDDDETPTVTPRQLLKALPQAIGGNTDEIDALMRQLHAIQLADSSIPLVRTLSAQAIHPNR